MKHLILGYGYCGYYLAQELLKQRHRVWTLSRSLKEGHYLDNVTHLKGDLSQGLILNEDLNVIHYMISPQCSGIKDVVLRQWLATNTIKTRKIIYYGSCGVYGDQEGRDTMENTECQLEFEQQFRYLDAEKILMVYGKTHQIPILILRISDILGPYRLPIKQIEKGESIIKVSEAPWSNTIYIKDLVHIVMKLLKKIRSSSTFNVSDGISTPMGATHRLLAILMQINHVYEKSFDEIYELSTPIGREFLMSSKKLSIDKLQKMLGEEFTFTDKIKSLKESLKVMRQCHKVS